MCALFLLFHCVRYFFCRRKYSREEKVLLLKMEIQEIQEIQFLKRILSYVYELLYWPQYMYVYVEYLEYLEYISKVGIFRNMGCYTQYEDLWCWCMCRIFRISRISRIYLKASAFFGIWVAKHSTKIFGVGIEKKPIFGKIGIFKSILDEHFKKFKNLHNTKTKLFSSASKFKPDNFRNWCGIFKSILDARFKKFKNLHNTKTKLF